MFIKLNTKSKTAVINLYFCVLKIPLTLNSLRSIRREIKNYKIINKSFFFKNDSFGILKVFSIYFGLILPKGKQILPNDKKFLQHYSKSFQNYTIKKKTSSVLTFNELENFLKKNLITSIDEYRKILDNTYILASPSHGDLHYKNIVTLKKKYYLIDLNFFNEKSSYLFDLINYKIFSSKYYKGNWFELIKKHEKKFHKIIDKDYLKIFILWKINNDLKYTKIDKFKTQKYKDILKFYFNNLI
tara:strand:- start:16728 stop:17456 length:729 start_codon:yes stop_codon:yes gene_type:complete